MVNTQIFLVINILFKRLKVSSKFKETILPSYKEKAWSQTIHKWNKPSQVVTISHLWKYSIPDFINTWQNEV